jgi:hypothetical protein
MKTLISLDTNIIVADYMLNGIQFLAFLHYLELNDLPLLLTETVFKETIQKKHEKLIQEKKNLEKRMSEFETSLASFTPVHLKLDVDIEDEIMHYSKYLKKKLNLKNHIPLKVNIEVLEDRAIKKIAPFTGEKGFRDALIWFSLLHYCRDFKIEKLVFITNNTKDFFQLGEELNDELQIDAALFNVEVEVFKSLNDFGQKYDPWDQIQIEIIDSDLVTRINFEKLIMERIQQKEYDNLFRVVSSYSSNNLDDYQVTYSKIESIVPLRIKQLSIKGNSKKVILLEAEGKIFFHFSFIKWHDGKFIDGNYFPDMNFDFKFKSKIIMDKNQNIESVKIEEMNYQLLN